MRPFIPKKEYRDAIEALKLGMTQLQPDGNPCAICEDSGHQAFECHHNPLVIIEKGKLFRWRCFHCGMAFEDVKDAEEHFGSTKDEIAVCIKEMARDQT